FTHSMDAQRVCRTDHTGRRSCNDQHFLADFNATRVEQHPIDLLKHLIGAEHTRYLVAPSTPGELHAAANSTARSKTDNRNRLSQPREPSHGVTGFGEDTDVLHANELRHISGR